MLITTLVFHGRPNILLLALVLVLVLVMILALVLVLVLVLMLVLKLVTVLFLLREEFRRRREEAHCLKKSVGQLQLMSHR
jgi:Flp pilus assembly protein TadB